MNIKIRFFIVIAIAVVLVYAISLYGCSASHLASEPIVETKFGTVKGMTENQVSIFLGIRYAAAPVEELRWKPPVDPPSWEGIYDATKWGYVCPQIDDPQIYSSRFPYSEDCLNLNVWTPAADNAKRPVVFFIPGGGWYNGSSRDPIFDGTALAQRGNMVVVSLNYRLSVFGFLYLAGLDDPDAANYPESGCLGILDQIKALEWVRDNIANFGGDPDNVTIFGDSAGAMCTCLLMATPRAKGLFHKAIAMSGGLNTLRSVSVASEQAKTVVKDFIKVNSIAELKNKTTEELRQALINYVFLDIQSATRFGAVMDGTIIPSDPLQSIANGNAADIPFLCGNTADEARYWGVFVELVLLTDINTMKNNIAYVKNSINATAEVVEGYTARHPEWNSDEINDIGSLTMKICSDIFFRIPVIRVAEAQLANQPNIYMYLFTWPSPIENGMYGACHTVDVGFAFNTNYTDSAMVLVGENPPAELANMMQDCFISFIRNGVPEATGLPNWPKYETTNRYTMQLDYRPGIYPALLKDPFGGDRRAWDGVPFNSSAPSL